MTTSRPLHDCRSNARISRGLPPARRQRPPGDHEFWPCSISLLDSDRIRSTHLRGPRHVTDVYLLALAAEHGGRLVTFDRTIPLSAAPGAAPENPVVL